jgi:non-ribosomal peptide synthetase component F
LLLAHYADSDDVVFGASFSGRPAEIRGIESMVGPCVNNPPLRIVVPARGALASWLAELQQAQFELTQNQYMPLAEIQQCSAIPPRYRLFDSLVVFQNYQVDVDALRVGGDAELTLLSAPEATNYPLTVAVSLGDELRIRLIHQPAMIDAADVRQFAADLSTLLEGIARGADVQDLRALLPTSSRGRAKAATSARTAARGNGYAAPTNDIERVIAEVWQGLFGVERISLDDNFFELGGHSLLLVRAHAQLRDKVSADLPIVALLQFPTIRSLARHLAGERPGAATADAAMDRARKQREALARQRNLTGKR